MTKAVMTVVQQPYSRKCYFEDWPFNPNVWCNLFVTTQNTRAQSFVLNRDSDWRTPRFSSTFLFSWLYSICNEACSSEWGSYTNIRPNAENPVLMILNRHHIYTSNLDTYHCCSWGKPRNFVLFTSSPNAQDAATRQIRNRCFENLLQWRNSSILENRW